MCFRREAVEERRQAACDLSQSCMVVLKPQIAATLLTAFPADPELPDDIIEILKRIK